MTEPTLTVEAALTDVLDIGWDDADLVEQLALLRAAAAAALSAVGRQRGVDVASAVRLLAFVIRDAARRVDGDAVGFDSTVRAAALAAGVAIDLADTPTASEVRH